jgi:FixJ family two-component response regulator
MQKGTCCPLPELGTSEITIKIHHGYVIRKMHAGSFADLVKMAEKLNSLSAS